MKKKEYQKRLAKEKQDKKILEETSLNNNIKTGLIIALSVIGFVLIMFVFTKIKTGEWNLFTKENQITYSAEVQSTKILCGSILNRTSNEYFVIAYPMKEESSNVYETLVERYNSTEKFPIYKLDLSNSKNNLCKGESLNISNDISELKVTSPTLLKIKEHNIVETYTDYDVIKNVLLSYID